MGSIVAGMYNGAVGLGGAAADILLLIQHQNIRVIARKLPRAGAPGHARADNDYIMHMLYLVLLVRAVVNGFPLSAAEGRTCPAAPLRPIP